MTAGGHGSWSRKLSATPRTTGTEREREREIHRVRQGLELSKPPTMPHLLNLTPKQRHQLGNSCSKKCTYGDICIPTTIGDTAPDCDSFHHH